MKLHVVYRGLVLPTGGQTVIAVKDTEAEAARANEEAAMNLRGILGTQLCRQLPDGSWKPIGASFLDAIQGFGIADITQYNQELESTGRIEVPPDRKIILSH